MSKIESVLFPQIMDSDTLNPMDLAVETKAFNELYVHDPERALNNWQKLKQAITENGVGYSVQGFEVLSWEADRVVMNGLMEKIYA